ncbi:DUF2314 domain-containing protein [uncultured Hyphomonas sp.]|uniref:DUF2314 domain-containing protein n=1 Tax=uncultured Hyphomonas sp. TaxID=225298 RepID=UPI002AAB562D|nr:DUF2314 domain-containing protein [uncultured Hyphomonas sp.]
MRAPGLLAALALLAACGGERVAEEGPPPLYKYTALKEAVADARETLPVFWEAYESGNPAYSDFALNVTTLSERYTEEHVWLVDVRQVNGEHYAGVIPEDREIRDGLTPGYMIAFLPEHIADWRFREDGKFRGAYTTRAMMNLAPDANIENIRAMFHDSPVP